MIRFAVAAPASENDENVGRNYHQIGGVQIINHVEVVIFLNKMHKYKKPYHASYAPRHISSTRKLLNCGYFNYKI